jgi:hypothetical protein
VTAVGTTLWLLLQMLVLLMLESCVSEALPLGSSATVPVTRTVSPALTGKLVLATKMPSEVAGSASASAASSWT